MNKSRFSHGPSSIHGRDDLLERLAREKVRIGACLRAHRVERGWTRGEAATRIGIHPVHLAKVELGTANVTLSTLTAMAAAYGLSLRAFFTAPPVECECA